MKVYEFVYNYSTYDGSSATISIHATRDGAEQAMSEHKKRVKEEEEELIIGCDWEENEHYEWDYGKYWGVRETELLP